MAQLDVSKVQEIVLKVQKGEELSPAEEKIAMEADANPEATVEDTPATDAKEAKAEPNPEKDGEEEGEPKAESEESDEKQGKDAEDTPSEEKSEPSEDTKQKDEEARKKALEQELDKPYGEEDLTDYSPKERALFFEMRRERRRRQEVQEELDLLKLQHLQERAREKQAPAKDKEADIDPFDGRDTDEFLTVGDVKKILANQQPKAKTQQESQLYQQNQQLLMRTWFLEGQMRHDDFNEVLNLAPEVLGGDDKATQEIMETARRGGNAALTTYNLVKASDKYKGGNGKDTEREVNEERAERIKQNEKKVRTTGGTGGSAPSGEMTYEELVSMSDEDFMKISPDKRNRLLKKFEGVL